VDGQICTLFTSSVFNFLLYAFEGYLREIHAFQRLSGHLLQILSKDPMQARLSSLFYFGGSELTDSLLAASLSLDLEGFIINSIAVTKTISTSIDEVRRILLILDRLRLVLSTLITPGLNANVDSICYGILSSSPSSAIVGLSRCVFSFTLTCGFLVIYNRNYSIEATTVYQTNLPQDIWSISPNVSAARALAIIVVLRAMSLFEGIFMKVFQYVKLMYICVQNSRKKQTL
jgi:hypothetical protein